MSISKTLKKNKKSCFEHHNHAECVANALFTAQEICKSKNLRLTDLRYGVLHQVWINEKPASAYDILAALQNDFPKAAPISIYRALDFLIDNGLIHRLETKNAYIGCRYPQAEHICAVLVCLKCGKAEEIKADKAFKELKKEASGKKFKAKKASIEIEGVCPSCRK